MKYIVIISAALALTSGLPKPKPDPSCEVCSWGSSGTSYVSSPVVYESAPTYTEYTHTVPVVEEVVSNHVPVVEHVNVAPVVQHHVPAPVVTSYTTQTVGQPEYILGKTTIHKTARERYNVQVPVTYNYEYERPVEHSTTYVDHYVKPAPVVTTHHVSSSPSWSTGTSYVASSPSYVVSSPSYVASSPSYVSSPSYASSSSYVSSPSYVASSPSYVSSPSYASSSSYNTVPSTSYVSAPSTSYLPSAPVSTTYVNAVKSPSSTLWHKDYTSSKSYVNQHEDYSSNSW